MKRNTTLIKRINDFLYDHYGFKQTLEILKYLFFAVASALIFSIGFTTFITPHGANNFVLATGGVSGVSQIIAKIFELFGFDNNDNTIQSIFYSVLNVPLIIFSFFAIGKKFAIFTAINVVATSIFVKIFSNTGVAESFATVTVNGGTLMVDSIMTRIMFAGVCTGVSSALAFVGGISCGGIDIVTYYLGNKKGTQLGKYNAIINGFIFLTYSLLTTFSSHDNSIGYGAFSVLYSCLYSLIVALVIDLINLKNKKVRVEIVTSAKNMGDILISIFPHGATLENAKGVYSKQDKYIVLMTVSSNEYKKLATIAKQVDPVAFVSVFSVVRVYGNFYSKPAE